MSAPRTVTVSTTKTLGQVAYEASDPPNNHARWHDLSADLRTMWERIAEAVAKALERPVHVPTPVYVESRPHKYDPECDL